MLLGKISALLLGAVAAVFVAMLLLLPGAG